jgi:hypothetical protein
MQMQQFRFYVQATANVGTPNGINAGFHFRNDAKRHCQRDKGGHVSIVDGDTGAVLFEFQRGEEVLLPATA